MRYHRWKREEKNKKRIGFWTNDDGRYATYNRLGQRHGKQQVMPEEYSFSYKGVLYGQQNKYRSAFLLNFRSA